METVASDNEDKEPTSKKMKTSSIDLSSIAPSTSLDASEEQLLNFASRLSVSAVGKINEFWALTSYSGPKISLMGIHSKVVSNKIEMKAKCLACQTYIKLNMIEMRTFSIQNYKSHAAKHISHEANGIKHLKVCSSNAQQKIHSFFKKIETAQIQKECGDQDVFNTNSTISDQVVFKANSGENQTKTKERIEILSFEEIDIYTEDGVSLSNIMPSDIFETNVSASDDKQNDSEEAIIESEN